MSSKKRIELYRHNEEAYVILNILLNRYRKACIVHPTGTGKSMIAFKYIQDNPGKSVLWMSPSGLIFRAQVDGLRIELDEGAYMDIVGRMHFRTYTSLLHLKDTLYADIIIIDEFHRCGALKWGEKVRKIIEDNKKAVVIGLSATNIRYYDNRRDMAKELFDDNVASRITLIEAVERKILPAPKYVVSMEQGSFTGIDKIQKQLSLIPDDSVKLPAISVVRKLRDSINSIEGLDILFKRYMEKKGRYIVFCSRKKQIDNIKTHIHKWFGRIDRSPNVYIVTYKTPKPAHVIRQFQEDDSDHLKLLLCVDILNEGIHISDINGAVLLRPTVSPVLFMQQTGRVLSVKGNGTPVIFDIVANFASLRTIESMYLACPETTYNNRPAKRIGQVFDVIDRTGNSRKLFGRLQKLLDEEWQTYYIEAKRYYDRHGDLDMDASYVTEEGLSLGQWVRTQKRIRAGLVQGTLTKEQERLLDFLKIDWDKNVLLTTKVRFVEDNFDRAIEYLIKYRQEKGDYEIPKNYCVDGFKLGIWMARIRSKRSCRNKYLKPLEQCYIDRLNEIGFPWDIYEYSWNICYEQVLNYYRANGNTEIKRGALVYRGHDIGVWIEHQRDENRKGHLTRDKIVKLILAGVRVGSKPRKKHYTWDEAYEIAREYYNKHRCLSYVPYYSEGGDFNLSYWLLRQRDNRSKLSEQQIRLLDDIGMVWERKKTDYTGAVFECRTK